MKRRQENWKMYRTKYLVRAKQLSKERAIVDSSGQILTGQAGDYLVVSSDGSLRVSRRHIFEDVYVELEGEEHASELERLATAC